MEANIARIKCFRNELCHSVSTSIPTEEFEDKWNTIASSLEAIKIGVYRKKIQALKNDLIDHKTRKRVEEEVEKWQQFKEQYELLFPTSGLPDSKEFDITLLHLLIREVCYLPAPLTGWHKMPADDEAKLGGKHCQNQMLPK